MSRVPGTFAKSRWALVDNPAYEGKTPTPMVAECHDGTPFITIQCDCGESMHMHESRVAHIPLDAEIGTTCLGCEKPLIFPPGFFATAFQQLRDDGWVA